MPTPSPFLERLREEGSIEMSYDQMFEVIDPNTLEVIDIKPRKDIHRNGDWHRAVNAFIFRLVDDEVEVLIQQRSLLVDIAQEKMDQSLATQLILTDQRDTDAALFRGMKEELGVVSKDVLRYSVLLRPDSIRLSKQYKDNDDIYNREIVTSYFILLKENYSLPVQTCHRVKNLQWMKWNELSTLVHLNPHIFTKTIRPFFISESFYSQAITALDHLIEGSNYVAPRMTCHYLSDSIHDFIALSSDGNKTLLEIFETRYSLTKIYSKNTKTSIDIFLNSFSQTSKHYFTNL
jgi:isopentenyldiphosphate isomerase